MKIRTLLIAVIGLSGCVESGSGSHSDAGIRPLANRPWDPASCAPVSPAEALGGTCTDQDYIDWHECTLDACQDQYAECYGPEFREGEYTGVCKPFMDCAQRCDCYDPDCVLACPIPQTCQDCFGATPCLFECELSCAAIGPREGKGCAETLACCPGLPNEQQRSSCASGIANVADEPEGDLICSTLYSAYAVSSTTCD